MTGSPLILRLDVAGTPLRWVPWQNAVCLYSRGLVAWTAGDNEFTFLGAFDLKLNNSVSSCKQCVVFTTAYVYARVETCSTLTNDDVTRFNYFATKTFDA